MSRFSITVMPGNTPRPSGDCEMPRTTRRSARSVLMSSPSKVMVPPESGRIPEIARMVVVLPAPLAPISVTISPCSTVRDTSDSAWIRP